MPFRPMEGWTGRKENAPAAQLQALCTILPPLCFQAAPRRQTQKLSPILLKKKKKVIFSCSPFFPFQSEPSRFLILALGPAVTLSWEALRRMRKRKHWEF